MKETIKGHKPDMAGGSTSAPKRIEMPFNRVNFLMMAGCIVLIIVGFALMSGGGNSDQTSFNPEIFSTRRIVVGPTLTFLGFLFMAFAIIWTPDFGLRKRHNKGKEADGLD